MAAAKAPLPPEITPAGSGVFWKRLLGTRLLRLVGGGAGRTMLMAIDSPSTAAFPISRAKAVASSSDLS